MEEAADYFIDSVLQSVADPAVDGTFLDDIGFGGEHAQMLIDTRLTKQEVAAINNASLRTYARLKQRLIAAGKFDWQSLGLGDFAGPGIKRNASTGNLNPFRQSFDLGCKPHNQLLAPGLHCSLPRVPAIIVRPRPGVHADLLQREQPARADAARPG